MPDSHVFAVASGKGGVGKTTTAVNLGAAAAATGRSVVVVDADLGMANVTDFLAVEASGATIHDALSGSVDAPAAAVPGPAGVDVVPGAAGVESFSDADPANLPDAVAALRERYDVVILDAGAGLSHDTVVPLGVADRVVLVTTPQTAAVRDARKTAELTERFGGTVAGVVVVDVCGVDDRAPDEVAAVLDADLLAAVPESPAVPESAEAGVPLREYAPEDAATRAYRDAAARLLGEQVPDDESDDTDDGDASVGAADDSTEDDGPEAGSGDDASEAVDADADAADAAEGPDPGDAAESNAAGADDGESADGGGVVIEDAESGAGESDEAAAETVLGDAEASGGDADAVPGDAMPTDLPGTGEDDESPDDDGGVGWLSRLTGGRLG